MTRYDLFAGALDRDFVWLEAFDDLTAACSRMRQRAQAHAGRYFVYSLDKKKTFAVVDTRLIETQGKDYI